jgi:hypothetical protein
MAFCNARNLDLVPRFPVSVSRADGRMQLRQFRYLAICKSTSRARHREAVNAADLSATSEWSVESPQELPPAARRAASKAPPGPDRGGGRSHRVGNGRCGAGPAGNRGRTRCRNPETASRRCQQIGDRSSNADRAHLRAPNPGSKS